MRIGQLARTCGCSPETIRYYERIGLLPPAGRAPNGYREYDAAHRKWLDFILRSKALGFSQREVRRLTDLAHEGDSPCRDVHGLIVAHIAGVKERLRELNRLQASLQRLVAKCGDGSLHDCPVIDELMN